MLSICSRNIFSISADVQASKMKKKCKSSVGDPFRSTEHWPQVFVDKVMQQCKHNSEN